MTTLSAPSYNRPEPAPARFSPETSVFETLKVLALECDSPLLVVDASGSVRFLNDAAAELLGCDMHRGAHSNLADWFEPSVAEERRGYVQRVISGGQGMRLAEVIRGRQFVVNLRPVVGGEWDGCAMLSFSARPPRQNELASIVTVRHRDMGQLASLSKREIEILQLIGEGLSQREIAERLQRGIKTIEAHRTSIGRKLGVRKNIHLAKIAEAAGLLERSSMNSLARSA
ncbi:MAG: LuxR C-terminal-related transcriptional regulator [Planctomycetota bacterium]|nr:LuxR C-terminal-related transcriptional regulator [Planctomycetota bacterium]